MKNVNKNKSENPFKKITNAQENYYKEFAKMIESWRKLHDYIKPFTSQNKEATKHVSTINTMMIALPLSHLVINTLHMTTTQMMKDRLKSSIPPLKISCPDCKKMIWDVTELKDFLKVEERD